MGVGLKMLILTRKKGESIVINENINITVLESSDVKVKLGIDAPKSIDIHRAEVYEEIEKSNRESVSKNINIENLKNILKK